MQQTAKNQPAKLRFGPFEVDRAQGRLYKRGVLLRVENHAFLVLLALLEHPDEIVTREELQQRIWGDGTNVLFEDGLNTAVRKLRHALGDSADSPLFIETIPKRGYRFVAPLVAAGEESIENENGIQLVSGDSGFASEHPGQPRNQDSVDEPVSHPSPATDPDARSFAVRHSPKGSKPDRFWWIGAAILSVATIAALLLWREVRAARLAASFSAIQAHKVEGVHTRESVAISPDGRYLAYERWDGLMSSIRLHQIANAGDVEILPPRETNYIGLTFSRDGSELYFVSNGEDQSHHRSLYSMPVLGGPIQKLVESIDSPVSFSSDGRQFAFARMRAETSALEVHIANADGSGDEMLEEFPGYAWGCYMPRAAWSPDGRTIAVAFRSTANPGQSSLYAIDVGTKKAVEVYSGAGCLGQPAWTGGDALIFSRQGDLWKEKDGRQGIIQLAGYGGRLGEQIDTSQDGKTAVAAADQSSMGLWVVAPQPDDATRQLMSNEASLSSVDELPDGRVLITKADSTIWTANPDGSDWRRVANVRGLAIVCGRFVVVQDEERSIVRFNPDGTGRRMLAQGPAKMPTCSLRGDSVFYGTFDPPQQIMRVTIDGGAPATIAKVSQGVMATMKVSPDGEFLAYSFYGGAAPKPRLSMQVLRASDGGLVSTLPEPRTGAWTFYWSPDGEAFDYVSEADGWTNIWEEPLSGGDPKQLTHFGSGQVNDFHWSRDGKRLLVVWGPTSDDVVYLTGMQ